jgi:Gpi18-like mannosyltransferase
VSRWKAIPASVWVALALAGSLALRLSLFPFVSGDMQGDMIPWSEFIAKQGAWKALGQDFSNYPPLYLYLLTVATWLPLPRLFAIKLVYVTFDYVLAWQVGGIAQACGATAKRWPAMLATLCLPTMVVNSALWGQCDAMSASGLAACVSYLLRGRSAAAMVAFGLAFSLKPQAVFLTPLLLVLVWQRRFSPLLLYVIPAVYVALAVPCWLAGRPMLDLILLYAHQHIVPFPALTLGATNLYQWLQGAPFNPFFQIGLGLAALSALALVVAVCRRYQAGLTNDKLLQLAMTSLVLMPFVLPAMHERYFFAADALAVAYAFGFASGRWVLLLIQFASAFTYLPYLFNWEPVPRSWLAGVMAVALGWLLRDLLGTKSEPAGALRVSPTDAVTTTNSFTA